jgi:hypothetical protein
MTYTDKVFPKIRDLPQYVIEAAAQVAMGDKPKGFKSYGSGCYNRAWGDGEYIIKESLGGSVYSGESIEGFAREWYKEYGESVRMVRAMKKLLVPTIILFDSVVVQEEVAIVINDMDIDDDAIGDIEDIMRDYGNDIGMTDLHVGNFGVHTDGTVRIFDPMVYYSYPGLSKRFVANLQKEIKTLLMRDMGLVKKKVKAKKVGSSCSCMWCKADNVNGR